MEVKQIDERLRGEDHRALVNVTYFLFNMYKLIAPGLLEHSRVLAKLCERLALRLDWSEDRARMAYLGGLFHDVGYLVGVQGEDYWRGCDGMTKADDLETRHPLLGSRLLGRVECLEPILPAVRNHHEHYDGTGYPDGLKGEAIPELARLLAVAHAYVTLTRGHATTDAMSPDEARQLLREDAGILYDPHMVDAFLDMLIEDEQAQARTGTGD